ncbi:hypothetical protein SEA_TESLA_8 [Mycobacterium phage Tesla]|uniref:Uncharacterized protein n=1 Tax=Mycobacterium phage Tesla TaxID=2079425 RepID=A0A2L1J046_9CAUD|nr:hypothetical protein SEA_TESLA_8 [Mycobacterium phage Tesla]
MNAPELRAVLTEALSRSYYRIVGSSSDCRVDPGETLADALLSLPGVAVIQLRADAEFIAAARTLIPELVAEVERLRKLVGEEA